MLARPGTHALRHQPHCGRAPGGRVRCSPPLRAASKRSTQAGARVRALAVPGRAGWLRAAWPSAPRVRAPPSRGRPCSYGAPRQRAARGRRRAGAGAHAAGGQGGQRQDVHADRAGSGAHQPVHRPAVPPPGDPPRRARGRRRRRARAAQRAPRLQAQLKEGTAEKLRAAVPALPDASLAAMKRAPLRQYDPLIVQDPLVYRLTEVRAARA